MFRPLSLSAISGENTSSIDLTNYSTLSLDWSRVCYPFFSPKCRHLKLASRYGVRRQLRPLWTCTTDTEHARHTKKRDAGLLLAPLPVYSGVKLCFYESKNYYLFMIFSVLTLPSAFLIWRITIPFALASTLRPCIS